jgi:cardiolipin synthase A/B
MRTTAWTAVSIGAIALLGTAIWSIRRHRDPILKVECDAPIGELVPSLAGLSLSTALPGNQVDLYENGAFYDVLVERIRAAKRTIHFETFLWKDGILGRRLAEAIIERARAGVKVRMLLDEVGGHHMGREVMQRLRDAGCRLKFFHKRSLRNLGVLMDRDHRKIVILDGREAFVGGHCIVDDWLGDGQDGQVVDLSVHVRGPVVNSIQGVFSENWTGETGEVFVGDDVFPQLQPVGNAIVHPAFVKPENSAPAVKILHHTAICLARERIWIQNPYFIPEPAAIASMAAAVKRGVDVRVLMPSTGGSDNPMVQHAGHRNFEKMLRAGVKLFEYPHSLLHQKVMTIDGIWSAIGSSNFDDRSFETNDEITLAVTDRELAGKLDAVFLKYVQRARQIELSRWTKRGVVHKAKDHAYYLVNELL